MDAKIEKILQFYKEKFIKAEPKPETDGEKEYYGQVFWDDPSDFSIEDEGGNEVKFEDIE